MVAVITNDISNEILNDSNMEKEGEKTIVNENVSSTKNDNKENLQNNNEEKLDISKNDRMDVDEEQNSNTDDNETQINENKEQIESTNIKPEGNNETTEIEHEKSKINNAETTNMDDDNDSIGLTSDEEDNVENEKANMNHINNISNSKDIKINNNINNKSVSIENSNNNIDNNSTIKNEIINQNEVSKTSTDISQSDEISPVSNNADIEQRKRHMPRYESSVCSLIIKTMERQPNALPFLKPVDPVALNIPDYFNVIKKPMDFSTILKKLKKGEYPSMNEFVEDVDLVFRNCMTYNPPNNPVHKMGQEMKNFFIEQLKKYPDHFSEILLNKFNIDLSTIENSERRPKRQVRPPQHFEPEDELLLKRIKQQQRRSLMEQNEVKNYIPKQEEEDVKMEAENYEEEIMDVKPSKASKTTAVKPNKIKKSKKIPKPPKAIKKRVKKRSYRDMEDDGEDEDIDELSETSTDSEDELVEQQITALTACLQQVQQQLELLQAQSNMSRQARKKSRRSISSFSEYYSNSEKETPISNKALAAAHRRINSTSNALPNPPQTSGRGRKKQNNIRKTAITNSALQSSGTRKRSKTKSETNSPAKRSPANSQGKVCEYCGGSETPMWRRGPSGKGSLCNKCGVKWKSGKIYKGEPIPSQSGSNANSLASSAVSTPNINPPPKAKRQKVEAPPKKPRVQSITYAQKKELSEMIGKLDEDNLNGVIEIIRSGIPDLKDGQEEIELDIETIDPVTLRKLYRYVKKVSKPVKVVPKPVNQELQNYSDYSSASESNDSGDESNDGE